MVVLIKIKEIVNILKFSKKAFTKGGFRHISNYISGLISSAKKTVKKIAKACPDEKHSSALNRILIEARFEKELLEKRYLKKIRHFFKNSKTYLLIDDTLVKHKGMHIEGSQKHFDHSTNTYVQGHQFFTAILYTPLLQLPLFPELYSRDTDSKIEMAKGLVKKLIKAKIKIHTVLFDSWYSDKNLLKTCIQASIRVICRIKSNRKVKLFRHRNWNSLSYISQKARVKKLYKYRGENKTYAVWSQKAYLNKLPLTRLVISREVIGKKLKDKAVHLISTHKEDKNGEILKTYKVRWRIETYHRDIKQNLGFAKAYFRKKEGIVRHAIFVAIAYAVLKLFMYGRSMVITIGTCCEYLQTKSHRDLVTEIIAIKEMDMRLQKFKEVFIS